MIVPDDDGLHFPLAIHEKPDLPAGFMGQVCTFPGHFRGHDLLGRNATPVQSLHPVDMAGL